MIMVVRDIVDDTMDVTEDCTDEEYLILRSKKALEQGNISEAKTWMLTARSIFPHNFSIQFEAYMSEKKAGNVKECAKCFQVINTFTLERQKIDCIMISGTV